MRAVVTGATGFVGRHVLKLLDRPNVLSRDADQARRDLAAFNPNAFSPLFKATAAQPDWSCYHSKPTVIPPKNQPNTRFTRW